MEFIVFRASAHARRIVPDVPPCQHAYIKTLYQFDVPAKTNGGVTTTVPIVATEHWVVNIPDMYLLRDFIDATGAIIIAMDTPHLYATEDRKGQQPLCTLTIYDDYVE